MDEKEYVDLPPEDTKPEAPVTGAPPAPEAPPIPKVRLDVFLKVAGPKWDQLAGFRAWANKQKLAPRSITEWRDELKRFQSKPTK